MKIIFVDFNLVFEDFILILVDFNLVLVDFILVLEDFILVTCSSHRPPPREVDLPPIAQLS